MDIEVIRYGGWPRCLRIAEGETEAIATLDVGPRILAFRRRGGPNAFHEFPDHLGGTGEPRWMARGGHRLWAAPEDPARTYFADNGPVDFAPVDGWLPGAVRLKPAVEMPHGLQKELDIAIAPDGTATVRHRLTNVGPAPTTLAPWALSVMAPGGTAIIPLPPKRPHPGPPENARGAEDFLPAFTMSVWPFTDFADDRWVFGSNYILLKQAKMPATKLGLAHKGPWVAYANAGTLFVKHATEPYDDHARYPDGGCNFETFTNEDMLEVETLGPLVTLEPGASAEHTEVWRLLDGVGEVRTEADVEARVAPLLSAVNPGRS